MGLERQATQEFLTADRHIRRVPVAGESERYFYFWTREIRFVSERKLQSWHSTRLSLPRFEYTEPRSSNTRPGSSQLISNCILNQFASAVGDRLSRLDRILLVRNARDNPLGSAFDNSLDSFPNNRLKYYSTLRTLPGIARDRSNGLFVIC